VTSTSTFFKNLMSLNYWWDGVNITVELKGVFFFFLV